MLQGALNTMDRFEHAEFGAVSLSEFSVRGIRFAYVVQPPIAGPHRLGETVAVNRGVNVKSI